MERETRRLRRFRQRLGIERMDERIEYTNLADEEMKQLLGRVKANLPIFPEKN